jgi:hypothetical protein
MVRRYLLILYYSFTFVVSFVSVLTDSFAVNAEPSFKPIGARAVLGDPLCIEA